MEKQSDDNKYNQLQWTQRKEKMKMEKRRQYLFRRMSRIGILAVIFALSAAVVWKTGILTEKTGYGNESLEAQKEGGLNGNGDGGNKEEQGETGNGDSAKKRGETGNGDSAEVQGENGNGDDQKEQSEAADGSNQQNGNGAEDAENGHAASDTGSTVYAASEDTLQLKDEIDSGYAVMIDIDKGNVLACKDETARIVPASMTKVLTLLVAAEHTDTDKFDDKFKITAEITDYCYLNECSAAGFGINEKVTVKDLMYGTILPSGADAAMGLAEYVAGSQQAFVKMMNEKLKELGLSKTAHFTNCVGIFDEKHYCTVLDMAVIMKAAIENETCQQVLSAHTYTTSKTKQHPEGIELSNWFLRRIEDKDTKGEVVCAKTGYVLQSGNCAVSYGVDKKERRYICVTANAPGTWKCIYDHVYLYKRFGKRKL